MKNMFYGSVVLSKRQYKRLRMVLLEKDIAYTYKKKAEYEYEIFMDVTKEKYLELKKLAGI